MISWITINGFQIHEHKHLKLDPHVTVLTGDNGAGKSATVRALKWLSLNQWDGKADQMTTWDADLTEVKAKIDGHKIIRRKSPTENLYLLDDRVFEAVGAGKVPAPVQAILNITEENFQEQLDPAFWFHLTAGQVAKSLNRIVNLSSIDTSLDNVARDLRQAREETRSTEQRLTEAKNLKGSLSWTIDADAKLTEIEGLDAKITRNRVSSSSLASKLRSLAQAMVIQKDATTVIQRGDKAVEATHELFMLHNKSKAVKAALSQLKEQRKIVCKLTDQLRLTQAQLKKVEGSVCPQCSGTGRKLQASS